MARGTVLKRYVGIVSVGALLNFLLQTSIVRRLLEARDRRGEDTREDLEP